LVVDLILSGAKVYADGRLGEADIAIDRGLIFKIAKVDLPQASARLGLKGCVVLPGMIDCHVHLRDQQLAHREDFLSGTMAAVAGGVTSVVDMPNNSPVTMDVPSLKERMKLAERRIFSNVAFYSAFPEDLEEIPKIVEEGAVAFKLYLTSKIGGLDIKDDAELLHAFEKVKEAKAPVAVHAEDKETIEKVEKKMQAMGRRDFNAYLEAHSPEAEAKAIQRIINLARESKVRVHLCHISSAAGLKTISKAKNTGLCVTCETAPHYLLLTQESMKDYGNMALIAPPLRTVKDIEILWDSLNKGLIDILASDHAPHAMEDKTVKSVWEAKPGIPGLETTLPLMLTQVNKGRILLQDLVKLTSERPAETFQLRGRGNLSEGCHADLIAVDMNREYTIDATDFYSKAKYSPFNGWRVKGKVVKTFVNGQLVMDEGEIVAKPGVGQVMRRVN